ncbi:NCS1 family nucleobase:cation symporter-1 [Flexivirga caeni]|uniref:Nitrate reductase n=1 Tax=Flexivirga caeni TaxID=2294115 RepID=A0A3M9M758_9MICO|nr:NCS1 family nucleobase:cation symporter-1 [Flexivirga caeni]RNI21362.1 nitrate reductase [Flexivirga caeni]
MTTQSASVAREGQVENPDGRVELVDTAALHDPALSNHDLVPVPVARRTWNTYNYTALWVGMSHNIPSWLLASGLVAAGMSWQQAVFIILAANVIVLIPILLNGHGGTKYGIPFPVLARSSFGVFGANLPALIRALAATCWFGVQTWIGGEGIFLLAGKMFGSGWANAGHFGGFAWTQWLSFFVFWLIEIAIIVRGIDTLKHFENWAAPVVLVAAIALLVYMWHKAGGVGDILSQPGTLHGHAFWKAFGPSLMGMIGFWATLSLNISDFTRFGGSQKQQALGQTYGLPTTMTLFALLSVFVTSASEKVYGEVIWDPIQLAARINNWVGTLLALATVMVATLAVNVAANLVSPSYDFANAVPKHINFRRGALITCVLSVLIMPWKLVSDPDIYIFTWLNFVGAILGPVAGILLADYWFVRRRNLVVRDLYTRGRGLYWYRGGWNWIAVLSFVVAALLAGGGSYSALDAKGNKTGPFPADGMIPFLKPLADYGWIVGLVSAAIIYTVLMKATKAPVSYDNSAAPADGDEEGVTV